MPEQNCVKCPNKIASNARKVAKKIAYVRIFLYLCTRNGKLYVKKLNMAYIDQYGVKFSDDRKALVRCPKNFKGGYVIPDGVTYIRNMAFD